MDVTDIATDYEEIERTALIAAARHPHHSHVHGKRQRLAEARDLAAQRGRNDPDVQALSLECENGCGEPLTVENDDIFCTKECAEDWERRERARRRLGR